MGFALSPITIFRRAIRSLILIFLSLVALRRIVLGAFCLKHRAPEDAVVAEGHFAAACHAVVCTAPRRRRRRRRIARRPNHGADGPTAQTSRRAVLLSKLVVQ